MKVVYYSLMEQLETLADSEDWSKVKEVHVSEAEYEELKNERNIDGLNLLYYLGVPIVLEETR